MEGIQIKAYFHFCTGEDHPVVFHNPEKFKIGMNLFAFSAKLPLQTSEHLCLNT